MNSSVHSQAVEAQTINSGGPRVVTLVRNWKSKNLNLKWDFATDNIAFGVAKICRNIKAVDVPIFLYVHRVQPESPSEWPPLSSIIDFDISKCTCAAEVMLPISNTSAKTTFETRIDLLNKKQSLHYLTKKQLAWPIVLGNIFKLIGSQALHDLGLIPSKIWIRPFLMN